MLPLHRPGGDHAHHPCFRVLVKAAFEQYGVARDCLRIGGRWQDHRMSQLLNDDWREPVS